MSTLIKDMGKLVGLVGDAAMGQNGYVKLQNGLIIQWGISTNVWPEQSATIRFPIQFPNACFVVVPGTHCAAGAGSDVWAQVNSFDKEKFTWFAQASGDVTNVRVAWIAIGH